ncbi:COBRA-like protein 10 precursor [Wolffia australiana]
MELAKGGRRRPNTKTPPLSFAFLFFLFLLSPAKAQDYDEAAAPPPEAENCDGIFVTYIFQGRIKEYPHVKNASAQAWAFKSLITLLNTGKQDLLGWNLFVGFQHGEILVSAGGAVLTDGSELPARVSNGTSLSGFPQSDLKNSIDTAGDLAEIQVQVQLTGTQFGLRDPAIPMPKSLRLVNDGFVCPKPTRHGPEMSICCVRDPKVKKPKKLATKFLPRAAGDLTIAYDVLQAFEGKYLAQVTLDNWNPLGRLDNWNLTWDWRRGEFIYSMRGAYTHLKDASGCIYGPAAAAYAGLDFTSVLNCERRPEITDLPPDRATDEQVGKLPFCCKNGTLLPITIDKTQSKAIFQALVFKVPPDMNRTALYPPENFKIKGVLNPDYVCGPPRRVSPMEFPDPTGLDAVSLAVASWQVVCNITRPKNKASRCCVSFSAYFNHSVVPCQTCACGCEEDLTCDPEAAPLLLPSEALLVPFVNRTAKAKAWAKLIHRPVPNPLPCGDFCGVSINWHVYSDYRTGWTARITIFNWEGYTFKDWFAAVQLKKAFPGFEQVYSFNGTKIPGLNDIVFLQGLPGLKYLLPLSGEVDQNTGSKAPGKQQSVISFTKKLTPGINIKAGDGFPTRVYFNGEECSLPDAIPIVSAGLKEAKGNFFLNLLVAGVVVVLI